MDPSSTVLSERTAAQVLARASELDQLRSAGSTVAELRVAATEAGIAAPAFEAALAEVQRLPSADVANPPARARRVVVAMVVAIALVGVAAVAVVARGKQRVSDAISTAPLLDEAIVLQCLAPAEAAEVIRPLLTLPGNKIVVRPKDAPRVLTLRATTDQLKRVRERLAPYEAQGSPACTSRPAP